MQLTILSRAPIKALELYNEIKNVRIMTEKNNFLGIKSLGYANNYKAIDVFGSTERLDNYNFICITDSKLSTINYNEFIHTQEEKRLAEEMAKSKLIDSPEMSPQQNITR